MATDFSYDFTVNQFIKKFLKYTSKLKFEAINYIRISETHLSWIKKTSKDDLKILPAIVPKNRSGI